MTKNNQKILSKRGVYCMQTKKETLSVQDCSAANQDIKIYVLKNKLLQLYPVNLQLGVSTTEIVAYFSQ